VTLLSTVAFLDNDVIFLRTNIYELRILTRNKPFQTRTVNVSNNNYVSSQTKQQQIAHQLTGTDLCNVNKADGS